MGRATQAGGKLVNISECYVNIPNYGKITVTALPDISDTKSAEYPDEVLMGRATPVKTYSHSSPRTISMTFHFFVIEPNDADTNLEHLRALASCVYPREGNGSLPYTPPAVCTLRCGKLLSDSELCVILKSYSVKFPTDVAWDEDNYTPYKFDVDTTWEVVYKSTDLPGAERIMIVGI